jgi:ketosteroid isomerase-like protein
LNFSDKQHQGSFATFMAKIENGRWKIIAENLMY